MTRRKLLALTGFWASARASGLGQHAPTSSQHSAPQTFVGDADITLRIGELSLELAPRRIVRTLAYNGQVPGPLLRAKRGTPLTVDVWNDTKDEDIVHWHGFHIPPDVDGSFEEGTPGVPPNGRRRYAFTPNPAGTRWYHSHAMAGRNLKKGTYTGQFGMFVVEDDSDPGAYDLDVPILVHEWDPHFTSDGPMDVEFRAYSINGRMLGAAEPIRVRPGQRVLFRLLNASATLPHRLALPAHQMRVIALDGNAVATPRLVPYVDLSPGERADAIVEMNQPGVWIFGETRETQRQAGMGVVVEYAGESGAPSWVVPSSSTWDYAVFGEVPGVPEPSQRIPLVFRPRGDYQWTINGKSFPRTDPIRVQAGRRYCLLFDNQSAHPHPVHLHRHTFEIVRIVDRATSKVRKDVVIVPAWRQVEVAFTADNPGPTLFHCHQQFHMDFGFMAMMQYDG